MVYMTVTTNLFLSYCVTTSLCNKVAGHNIFMFRWMLCKLVYRSCYWCLVWVISSAYKISCFVSRRCNWVPGSSVNIVPNDGLEDRGSIHSRNKVFFFF
jgi:hypothetical protein